MISGSDCFWVSFSFCIIGFLGGSLLMTQSNENIKERTMVEFNLAHYDGKTKEFVADSLEFKNDTIIIRKKD